MLKIKLENLNVTFREKETFTVNMAENVNLRRQDKRE